MSLKCANCGASVELSGEDRRRMAGKFFACPECGASKRLPIVEEKPAMAATLKIPSGRWSGLSWSKRGMILATAIWAFCWLVNFLIQLFGAVPPSSHITSFGYALACAVSASINTLPFYLLVIVVLGRIAWWKSRPDLPLAKKGMVIATGSWPLLGMVLVVVLTIANYRSYRPVGGGMLASESGSFVSESAAWRQSLVEGIINGGIFSTVIYFVVIFVLFVVWFATRKDSRP